MRVADRIHVKALALGRRYRQTQSELITVLIEVERERVFVTRGHSSLHRYVVDELGLSDDVAYALITVARKSREVPLLAEKIQAGEITLTNARRVSSVLTRENQSEWLKKAAELTSKKLEREIVRVKPGAAVVERASYVTPERVRLELGVAEHQMLRLRRAQDLMSQKEQRAVSLEETLARMTDEFLHRHDPVEKAKRAVVVKRKSPTEAGQKQKSANAPAKPLGLNRVPITAALRHQVNLRDQGRCTHIKEGSRCQQRRWLDIHHIQPVSQGGPNALENLATLCANHHRFTHR